MALVMNLLSHEEHYSPNILPFKGQLTEVSESDVPVWEWVLIPGLFQSFQYTGIDNHYRFP